MEKVVRKFKSHAEADRANREYYHKLTPQQRLDILLELVARYREGFGPDAERFARVYRVVQRKRRWVLEERLLDCLAV